MSEMKAEKSKATLSQKHRAVMAFSLVHVLDLAAIFVAAASKNASALSAAGWSKAETARLRADAEKLSAAARKARDARVVATAKKAAMTAELVAARTLKRKLVRGFKLVTADDPANKVAPELRAIGERMGVVATIRWLQAAESVVKGRQPALAKYLGKGVLGELESTIARLLSSKSEASTAARGLTTIAHGKNELAAVVRTAIGRLQLVAQIAFDGQPGVLKEFRQKTEPVRVTPKAAAKKLAGQKPANDAPKAKASATNATQAGTEDKSKVEEANVPAAAPKDEPNNEEAKAETRSA